MKPRQTSSRRGASARLRAAGFSLVELMVAMTIGLVVVGAVLATYVGNTGSARGTTALGQITEDADIALRMLRIHLSMADYSRPWAAAAGGAFSRTMQGDRVGLFGCDGGFADVGKSDAPGDSATTNLLSCNGDTAAKKDEKPDAIALRYEGDGTNTYISPGGKPTDCLGQEVALATPGGGAPTYYFVDNRFFVDQGTLKCKGNAPNTTPQPMVDNVVNLQFTYGVAAAAAPGKVQQYLTAAAVTTANAWDLVVSVRACVVVRSETQVLDEIAPYYGCSHEVVTPTDKAMYRSFTTTVLLHNRAGA